MLGRFSRFGVWRQILLAVVCVVPLQVIWNASEAIARSDAEQWYLAYAQPVAAAIMTLILVAIAGKRRQMRRSPIRRQRSGAVEAAP